MRSTIGHHRGGVELGPAEIDNGVYVAAIRMASNPTSTVTTQQVEIDQMTKVVGG
jgi:uncharacterized protein (DUF305 family)